MSRRNNSPVLVAAIETKYVKYGLFSRDGARVSQHELVAASWDCEPFLQDPSGQRLVEELVRRTQVLCNELDIIPSSLAVSLPGTLQETSTVLRSTRLGIRDAINVSEKFARSGSLTTHLFNDAECMAIGEARHGALRGVSAQPVRGENFCYILADEGVGSSTFIGGVVQKGAGSAGHLGRLVVEPGGIYNKTFTSRGPLEVFTSRPWVSQHIVGEFMAERGKRGAGWTGDHAFRAAVQVAAEGDWSSLSISHIAEGVRASDPIATTVIDDAARYLGWAVNAVIAITNPPAILLGGAMIEGIPGFSDAVISYARRFSWELAWNRTDVRMATLGRKAQFVGAAELLWQLT